MHDNHQFALCRTFGHDWDILQKAEFDDAMLQVWKFVFVLRCERCHMKRIDGVNAYGEVAQRRYIQPIGYSYAKDETPPRTAFRLYVGEHVTRTFPVETVEIQPDDADASTG